ncbi:MAG: hypothetical protein ACPKQO_07570 [Nitrososphaeraceae archaeon]
MTQNGSRNYIFVLITFGILFMLSSIGQTQAQPVNEYTENVEETNTFQMQQPKSTNEHKEMSIKITSHNDADEVDIGELTISGISSDTTSTDCIVEVDWNNKKPYQIVTPTGPGGQGDYSTWEFTYTNEYNTIKPGNNDLTSKLTCINPGPLTEWYSVTIIGKVPPPSLAVPLPNNDPSISNSPQIPIPRQ